MQCHIHSLPGSRAVLCEKATERIKRCSRVRIQQGVAQSGLAHFTNREVLAFVAGITEARLPVPCLEVISNPSHLTAQTNIEELVPVGELLGSRTSIV